MTWLVKSLWTVAGLGFGLIATGVLAGAAPVAKPNVSVYTPNIVRVADTAGCGTQALGIVTVQNQNRAPTISLLANGHPVNLLIDTGAERTILTAAAAERVGAQSPQVSFPRNLEGISKAIGTREVELTSFSAEGVMMPGRRVLVASIALPQTAVPLDGVLGADLLASFDLDLDLRRQRLVLYEKQSCAAAAPSWSGPYMGMEVGRSPGNQIFFPVGLDGRRIVALLDSGAQRTGLSKTVAQALGVSDAMLATDRTHTIKGAGGEALEARIHRFSRLQIGTVLVRNPELAVVDAKFSDKEMILGADFLGSVRLWLSYGSRRMFLTTK
jgi:predicted aspartyl protease